MPAPEPVGEVRPPTRPDAPLESTNPPSDNGVSDAVPATANDPPSAVIPEKLATPVSVRLAPALIVRPEFVSVTDPVVT